MPFKKASISFQQEGQTFRCQSVRKGKTNPPISFQVKYTPVSEVYFPKEGTLDHWLTERYCLFSSDNGNDIFCGEIHHRPWPLQKASAHISRNTLFSPFHLAVAGTKPVFHFSKGVDTLMWNIKKTRSI